MSAQLRYVSSRGKFGSPIVVDTHARRPVLVCLRDTSGETEADAKAADEAALIMAQLCAMTLNKTDAAKRQRENRP